ncbi:GGDEF domain-containing protein [Vibrio metoecus]|uniref:tetratricopeptide repeat protein n=1 Tax=Vibrio metoecus TaxID=1481663 RepID=UPI0006D77C16|nr:tetratricopeptide repeat protein [Vibrio metoecus]KQB07583.1 diguanylate cyclase [Vibrio metoecus]PAR50111.1 GGDEF domain-containing protein [Vibrio metoecus]
MKLYLKLSLLVLSLFASLCTASERSAWEEVYAKSLYKDDESALQLLRDRYRSLPDGTEKLYIISKIQGYFVLKGQPYYGETAEAQDAYTATEQRFLEALNQEEALNYQNAEATYLAFYSDMKQQDDQDGLVLFEYHLCRLFQRHGRPYKARFYCSQMDQRLLNAEDPLFPRYRGLHLVANNLEYLGEYQEALGVYDTLLKLLPDYVDPSAVYNDVGLLMSTLGQYEPALEYLNKALEYRQQQGNPLLIAQVEHSLGDVYFKQGKYEQSIEHFIQAEKLLSPSNYLFGLAYVHLGLGKAYVELNNFTEGDQHLLQALDYVNQHQDQYLQSLIYLSLSQAFLKEQKYHQAVDYANQAITIAESASLPRIKAESLLQLATIADHQQQYQQALNWYRQYAESELQLRNTEQRKAFEALDLSKAELEQKRSVNFWRENYQTLTEKYEVLKWQRISLSILILLLALALPFAYYRRKRECAQSTQDRLHGVLSRTAGLERLTHIAACTRSEQTHLLALLDIDQLREFNEHFGYEHGDAALQSMVNTLQKQLGAEDFLCRLGDDEFLIVMPNSDRTSAETRIFTLHYSVNTQDESQLNASQAFSVTMSYLALDGSLANEHHFYPQLDTALSIAKKNGRSGVVDAADPTTGLLTACSSTH